jgi:hypothetical protein
MECGGVGGFQAVKLQRPTRATVCSHPMKGMAATFHSIQNDHDDCEGKFLSS